MKICWANYLLWFVIAVLGGISLLSGCGQKGDLYLPEDEKKKEEKAQTPIQSNLISHQKNN